MFILKLFREIDLGLQFIKQPFHLTGERPSFIFIRDVPSPLETLESKRRWRFISRQLSSLGCVLKVLDVDKVIQKVTNDPEQLADACLRKITSKVLQVGITSAKTMRHNFYYGLVLIVRISYNIYNQNFVCDGNYAG